MSDLKRHPVLEILAESLGSSFVLSPLLIGFENLVLILLRIKELDSAMERAPRFLRMVLEMHFGRSSIGPELYVYASMLLIPFILGSILMLASEEWFETGFYTVIGASILSILLAFVARASLRGIRVSLYGTIIAAALSWISTTLAIPLIAIGILSKLLGGVEIERRKFSIALPLLIPWMIAVLAGFTSS